MRKGIETVTLCWLVPRKQLISLILCRGRILHSSNPKKIIISFPKQILFELTNSSAKSSGKVLSTYVYHN